jgi:hypothetical protein
VFQQKTDLLLKVYNACLREGLFPKQWKIGRLVLVSKGKGGVDEPSSYQLLCMLDTAGKVLEKLIRRRLTGGIKEQGDLSPKQFGFRSEL